MNIASQKITRLEYFLIGLILSVVDFILGLPMTTDIIVFSILLTFITRLRFNDIGWKPEYSLLGLVPVVNLFVFAAAATYPTNYAVTKKMGAAGTIMIAVQLALLLLIIYVFYMLYDMIQSGGTSPEELLKILGQTN